MQGNIDPLWQLADALTVRQAAALLAGYDPADVEWMPIETILHEQCPRQYSAETILLNAARAGTLKVGNAEQARDINAITSYLQVKDLSEWLRNKGFRDGFFFLNKPDAPDYLNPSNPRYSPKLAAAVCAWIAATDLGGKSPRQSVGKWLREHAAEFGLTDEDGRFKEPDIEEATNVAVWPNR